MTRRPRMRRRPRTWQPLLLSRRLRARLRVRLGIYQLMQQTQRQLDWKALASRFRTASLASTSLPMVNTHHHAHICMPGLVWAWWGAGSCLTWLVTGVPGSCAPKLADDLQLSPLASACLIIFVTLPAFGMFCFLGDWV
jgi:hypothetical protein